MKSCQSSLQLALNQATHVPTKYKLCLYTIVINNLKIKIDSPERIASALLPGSVKNPDRLLAKKKALTVRTQ
jgi:hypothetical protein